MWEEAIEMIPKMWTNETFCLGRQLLRRPAAQVLPKPIQKPHPPLWMACTQPESFRIAGSKGLGALSFGFIAPGVLEASLSVYRDAIADAKPVGEFINNQFAATSFASVAPTDEEALKYGRPAADFFQESIGILFVPWAKKTNVPSSYQYYQTLAPLVEERMKLDDGDAFQEQWDAGTLCIGTPERVRNAVQKYADAGCDQLILMVQIGRIPHESVMQTIKLMGEEVIPPFKRQLSGHGPTRKSPHPPWANAAGRIPLPARRTLYTASCRIGVRFTDPPDISPFLRARAWRGDA